MSFYETLYIVDPNLESKTLEKTMDEIGKELEKTKSKIINHRLWNKKRLAFPIQKQKYGSYILLQFEGGDQEKMLDYDTWMRLNNLVLRHMTVLLDQKPEVYIEEKISKSETKEMNSAESSGDELPTRDIDDLAPETLKEEFIDQENISKDDNTSEQKNPKNSKEVD